MKRATLSAVLVAWALAGFVLIVALEIAQSTNGAGEKSDRSRRYYEELARAPEKARNLSNPFEGNPDALAAGRKLFEQHCAECHGDSAEGKKRAPSLRVQEVKTAASGAIFWVVTNGVVRRGMPVWSKLPEQQRWQIVSYLKSLN